MEQRIASSAGIDFAPILAGKYRRNPAHSRIRRMLDVYNLALNTRDMAKLTAGVIQSLKLLRAYQPDAVFIKGGFVGLPVGIAASLLRIPYLIHESDISPGLTNRVLAKRAVKIAVGFPVQKYPQWDESKLEFTGNPIRKDILGYLPAEALNYFGLSSDLPVILVTGGSQGARAINEIVLAALPKLLEKYQVIHVTGEKQLEAVQQHLQQLNPLYKERYVVKSFLLHDIGQAYAAADLVVARAGAGTIAELAALAKPAILIPNQAMAAHQIENAKALSRTGAAKVLYEHRLTPEQFVAQIDQIMESESDQQTLAGNIKEFSVPDADRHLAELIYKVAAANREASR